MTNLKKPEKICQRCVMDSSVKEIIFYPDGRCSLCRNYDENLSKEIHVDQQGKERFKKLIKVVKKTKKGKYDCLIGISGGVDSSFVAHLVKMYELNPLAVHLDNGWNTELAVDNVEKLVKELNIDLYTEVLNWNEFKSIQKSFLLSSISNIEIPTDHAIWATLAKIAKKEKIKYIFAGNNVVTESIMPESWLYHSKDFRLIKAINKKFGKKNISSFPRLSLFDYFYLFIFRGIRWVPVLNYFDYIKEDAKKTLIDQYGWRDYGGKHYESIFTRFFHAFYLPKKFGYDLRKSYLSALICSNQITRDEALMELSQPPADEKQLIHDVEYVKKKLNFSNEEFENMIDQPTKSFKDYPNNDFLWTRFSNFVSILRSYITRV